jgi:hypothetical protein
MREKKLQSVKARIKSGMKENQRDGGAAWDSQK